MALCDECIKKENCGVQEFFEEGKLLLSHCRNFVGEAPREIKTNFQRITASPEALAEFSMRVFKNCAWCLDGGSPEECPFNAFLDCPAESKENMVKWLKQESE